MDGGMHARSFVHGRHVYDTGYRFFFSADACELYCYYDVTGGRGKCVATDRKYRGVTDRGNNSAKLEIGRCIFLF